MPVHARCACAQGRRPARARPERHGRGGREDARAHRRAGPAHRPPGREIERKNAELQFKTAKLDKITFELARLKAWKFGAKTEAMSAEQRRLFEETLAEDEASLQAQLQQLQAQLPAQGEATDRAATQAQAPGAARAPAARGAPPRARGHHLPDAGCGTADAARGRGREREAGHRAGAVLRASPRARQVGLQVLPGAGARTGGPADHRRRHARGGAGGAHADQPLRRSPAVLPARRINARSGVHTPRSTLAHWSGRAARRSSRCSTSTSASCWARACCTPTRRRWRCSIPARARPRRPTSGPMRAARSMPRRAWCTTSAWAAARKYPMEFLGGTSERGSEVARHAGSRRVQGLRQRARCEDLPRAHRRRLPRAREEEVRRADQGTAPAPWPTEAMRRIAVMYRVERELAMTAAADRLAAQGS